MPKIDLNNLLSDFHFPDEKSIRDTLGKKAYSTYQKIIEKNGEANRLQNCIEMMDYLNEHDKSFGIEGINKKVLFLVLAAKSNGIFGLKQYDAAIDLIEAYKFKQEIYDPRINELHHGLIAAKDHLKSQPILTPEIDDSDLKENISVAYSLKNTTLANRLDAQYAIYNRCKILLESGTLTSPIEKTKITEYQSKALDFMAFVLDTPKNINRMNLLMEFRAKHREHNPEFIPGITPARLVRNTSALLRTFENEKLNNDKKALTANKSPSEPSAHQNQHEMHHQSSTKTVSLFLRAYENVKLANKKKLLNINSQGLKKDIEEDTLFQSREERDEGRVIINGGKLYTRLPDNNFEVCDTNQNISKSGSKYAAFVLNNKGELTIFNHYDAGKPFFHSSPNSQANLYGAGEIKIENGKLIELTSQSGHYWPDRENITQILQYFQDHQVDISNAVVQIASYDAEADELIFKKYKALDLVQQGGEAKVIADEQSDFDFDSDPFDDTSKIDIQITPERESSQSHTYSTTVSLDSPTSSLGSLSNSQASSLESSAFDDDWAQFPSTPVSHSATNSAQEFGSDDDWASFPEEPETVKNKIYGNNVGLTQFGNNKPAAKYTVNPAPDSEVVSDKKDTPSFKR